MGVPLRPRSRSGRWRLLSRGLCAPARRVLGAPLALDHPWARAPLPVRAGRARRDPRSAQGGRGHGRGPGRRPARPQPARGVGLTDGVWVVAVERPRGGGGRAPPRRDTPRSAGFGRRSTEGAAGSRRRGVGARRALRSPATAPALAGLRRNV